MRCKALHHELPPDSLPDGVYWVRWGNTEGGFTIRHGRVTHVAPCLTRGMERWFTLAVRIGDA